MFSHLFSEGSYRFHMRFEKGTLANFYAPTGSNASLLGERTHWLATARDRHAVALPEAEPLLNEFVQEIQLPIELSAFKADLPGMCAEIGRRLEPDFLLLTRKQSATRLVAGCVCFPSSWDLREKLGLPIEQIHAVVPGLNAAIQNQIQTFLDRLRPGISWERSNWGLSRSPELNQHPARNLPRLDEQVGLDEVFFRIEHQSLAALPQSNGVLFGIRIQVHPLGQIREQTELRDKLLLALETMPEEMAAYKNLARARPGILQLLRE